MNQEKCNLRQLVAYENFLFYSKRQKCLNLQFPCVTQRVVNEESIFSS